VHPDRSERGRGEGAGRRRGDGARGERRVARLAQRHLHHDLRRDRAAGLFRGPRQRGRTGARRRGGDPYYDDFDVRYETAAHGDIDGDGAPDTVVLLQCSPQPSNGTLEEVQVFSADHGRLGTLPSPTTLPEAVMLAPLYDPAGLSVDHGDIVAGMKVYGPHDSHASGPSEHVTVRWHWDGQSFVRVP
jgi:hypothetical protein